MSGLRAILTVPRREGAEEREVRLCVVLDLYSGRTAWLDVSQDEFERIPELEVSGDEWETAMCAGTPPPVPAAGPSERDSDCR